MLMKLTQGVDFTNIFTPSFWTHGAQKRKKTNDLTAFLTLLGSARVKAVHRTLMKLSQGWTTLVLIYSMNSLFLYRMPNGGLLFTAFTPYSEQKGELIFGIF